MPNIFKTSTFWIRLLHWEYWPLPVVYIPVYIYWFWLSIKARSFFFFTASNPGIEYGGMLGESKIKIMKTLPEELIPKTAFIDKSLTFEKIKAIMKINNVMYPVILKPDIGERGWMVEKINSEDELREYLTENKVDYLLQEYIEMPVELGVFYYRYPDESQGKVTSIVEKKMLSVIGDGSSSVIELMRKNPRAVLQIKTLEQSEPELLQSIPPQDKKLVIMPIGNHIRGTAFLNGNKYINDKLNRVFDELSKMIEGFFFGRFDLRCESIEALYEGKMKIMELNGAGAEPAHIYHPNSSLWTAYKVLLSHWKVMYDISVINHKKGIPYLSLREGMQVVKNIKKYNKLKKNT